MSEADEITPNPDPAASLPLEVASPPTYTQPAAYVAELPLPEDLERLLPEGEYTVECFIGQGGMGAVYKGLQMPLRRPVAIKILQRGTGLEYDFEERFRREAYAMAALTHPNIVHVYDCGNAGPNYLFITMELVEGGDLSRLIREGPLPQEQVTHIVAQICEGLQFAHDHGIVHRDIKPANIMLTGNGRVKVGDFGLAKKFDAHSSFMTKTGLGMGTPDYAAPEQYEGSADLDHRADIYALGVMMYQMLTGKLPRGVFKQPSELVQSDPRLDEVISRAMLTEREYRWRDTIELKKQITHIATVPLQKPSTQPKVSNSRPVPGRSIPKPQAAGGQASPVARAHAVKVQKKSPSLMIVSGIAALVLGLGGYFFFKSDPPTPPDPEVAPLASDNETPERPRFPARPFKPPLGGINRPPGNLPPPPLSAPDADGWRSLFTRPIEVLKFTNVKIKPDGWAHLQGGYMISKVRARDATIRATVRSFPSKQAQIKLHLEMDFRWIVAGVGDDRLMHLQVLRTTEPQSKTFKIPNMPKDGEEYTLALKSKDDEITVFFNGVKLGSIIDKSLPEGHFSIYADDAEFKDVMWKDLSD
ncbi:hypothetical protein BH11VER1_BH11VER1_25120 [soil metagenome]